MPKLPRDVKGLPRSHSALRREDRYAGAVDSIDPDDPRPPFRQVADVVRAAILTGRLAPGDKIPSGPELADRYHIAKNTAQKAVDALKDEGLVVARHGSGVYVRERTERAVGLRPHIERAFAKPEVTIDFAGFSGETLHGALVEPLDKVRHGGFRPESITVRVLVPDTSVPWALPATVDGLADSPAFRRRAAKILERHTNAVLEEVQELGDLGIVPAVSVEARLSPIMSMFKVYIINESHSFFGFYPIEEHAISLDSESVRMWDLMGKNATMFSTEAAGPNSKDTDAQFVKEARAWFESLWNISKPHEQAP